MQTNFNASSLKRCNFSGAVLSGVDFGGADLTEARIIGANLQGANLFDAQFTLVNLTHANLKNTNLFETNFEAANLGNVILSDAVFYNSILRNTILTGSTLLRTVFTNTDLSQAIDIDTIVHDGPSAIDRETLIKSGLLPAIFLKGIGFTDWEIEQTKLYQPGLSLDEFTDISYRVVQIRNENPIRFHKLFISYNHENVSFVEALERLLDEKGIRFWRDVHHAIAGPLEEQVALAMQDRVVLLVLSKHSVNSDWVEWEVRKAREIEKSAGRHVLCPVALDDSWNTCDWPGRLRAQIEEYNILDFSHWQEQSFMTSQFEKLLKGLDLFYKGANGNGQPGTC